MAIEPGSLDQLSQVISHAIAPAFLLGAVAAFISMLSSRIDVVLGRIRSLNAIPEDDPDRAHLRQDTVRLSRRLQLLHRALLFAVASGVVTTILMILSFALAVLGVQHVWSAAILFIVALALFCVSVVTVGVDGMNAVHRNDHF